MAKNPPAPLCKEGGMCRDRPGTAGPLRSELHPQHRHQRTLAPWKMEQRPHPCIWGWLGREFKERKAGSALAGNRGEHRDMTGTGQDREVSLPIPATEV